MVSLTEEERAHYARHVRDLVVDKLFDIHMLALDAHNDPTVDNITAVVEKLNELHRILPAYYRDGSLVKWMGDN